MVFDTSPTRSSSSNIRLLSFERMFPPSDSTVIDLPLSDERELSQIEASQKQQQTQAPKWKMISKRRQSCTNDMYASAASRYHRLKTTTPTNPLLTSDDTLPSPLVSNLDKFQLKNPTDDLKCVPNSSSSSIVSRRSTTDCNDLLSFHQRPSQSESNNTNLLAIVDEELRDSTWPSSGNSHQ